MKPWTVIIQSERGRFIPMPFYANYDKVLAWSEAHTEFLSDGRVVAIIPGSHEKEVYTGPGRSQRVTEVFVEEYPD